jgi:hypothetical protein
MGYFEMMYQLLRFPSWSEQKVSELKNLVLEMTMVPVSDFT